jgi:hypothetical protein
MEEYSPKPLFKGDEIFKEWTLVQISYCGAKNTCLVGIYQMITFQRENIFSQSKVRLAIVISRVWFRDINT